MKLTKTTPPALALRGDLDRIFDRFFEGNFFAPPAASIETTWAPALDFCENEKEYVVRLEVPGIPKENLDVNLDGQTLTISGHREARKEEGGEQYYWREREEGRFMRSLRLPQPVDESGVEASTHDGVLMVKLPKTMKTIKSKVTIK